MWLPIEGVVEPSDGCLCFSSLLLRARFRCGDPEGDREGERG